MRLRSVLAHYCSCPSYSLLLIKAYEDILVEEERKSKIPAAISSSVDAQNKEKNGTDAELSQSIPSIAPGEFQKSSFDDDIGSNNSGYYELKVRFSLVTIRL